MLLTELLNDHNLPEVEITDITCDSREVNDGCLFFALTGAESDGAKFIPTALKNEAFAVLTRFNTPMDDHTKHSNIIIESSNPRRDYSKACFNFYGRKQPKHLVAVTGTNGKTSIANFARQIWQLLGFESASIGTIGVVTKDSYEYGERTTPDSKTLYKHIAEITDKGVTHLAVEASSHGIIQNRLDDLHLKGAGWTNLTPEHLDYHTDMASYYHAKARLFSDVLPAGESSVLNADTPEFKSLNDLCLLKGQNVIDYGINGQDIKIVETKPLAHGQEIILEFFGKQYDIKVDLVGSFQASNLACALGLVVSTNPEYIERANELMAILPQVRGVDGRMELIGKKDNGANIYVDYAHSPDGLENMLRAIRPHVHGNGRLICVFGCGGDRDATKRPKMGKLVEDLADVGIITDDNPRTEDPAKIREAIQATCPSGINIDDRRKAVAQAIDMLGPEDLLIVAGKGHETGQTIGTETIHYNDKEEILKHISMENT